MINTSESEINRKTPKWATQAPLGSLNYATSYLFTFITKHTNGSNFSYLHRIKSVQSAIRG